MSGRHILRNIRFNRLGFVGGWEALREGVWAIESNGTLLKIVRVFALFQCHPLIKFKSSKKLVNCQTPALFLNSCYKLGVFQIS